MTTAVGFGLGLPYRQTVGWFYFQVLASNGDNYTLPFVAATSTGQQYTIPATVLDSTGTAYIL